MAVWNVIEPPLVTEHPDEVVEKETDPPVSVGSPPPSATAEIEAATPTFRVEGKLNEIDCAPGSTDILRLDDADKYTRVNPAHVATIVQVPARRKNMSPVPAFTEQTVVVDDEKEMEALRLLDAEIRLVLPTFLPEGADPIVHECD